MRQSLIVSINGRDALPVRAIPYVAGRSFYSPDEVAKHLARAIDAPFARLQNTTAFRLSGQSPKPVLPKDWHATVAYIDALESKLKRKQHSHAEGYAKWLKQATRLLPAGVFVWCKQFDKDFRRDIKKIATSEMRKGDDKLDYSPMLLEHERKMILEGAPTQPADDLTPAQKPDEPADAPAEPSNAEGNDTSTDAAGIQTRIGGEPLLVKGKNSRKQVDAWVKFQAKANVMKIGDTAAALAERIHLMADRWGYESERGKLTIASITKMLPAGITGGRAKARGRPIK